MITSGELLVICHALDVLPELCKVQITNNIKALLNYDKKRLEAATTIQYWYRIMIANKSGYERALKIASKKPAGYEHIDVNVTKINNGQLYRQYRHHKTMIDATDIMILSYLNEWN